MSGRGVKRQRTGVSSFVTPKRPIDKKLINVSHITTVATQDTVLTTATFPCTITGLRWEISTIGGAAGLSNTRWAIVIVRDGVTHGNIASSDASDFYTPEQDVMAFGSAFIQDTDLNGQSVHHWGGTTKSMRKLMGGDQIVFLSSGSVAVGAVAGVVQLFCKS